MTDTHDRLLLTGNESIALAAFHAGVRLGTGYPGTPATEILEHFSALGGQAQWAPNEKVALEVALGAAFAGARSLVAMKHVGLNVAADPFFSAAYTDVKGALVVVSTDDPGMASSQTEQDNRNYAAFAGVPMLEPADSQDAYDLTAAAIEISERWRTPVLLRLTTRICHSKTVVRPRPLSAPSAPPSFERDIKRRVLIPAYSRPAHRIMRKRLADIQAWAETSDLCRVIPGDDALGIITSGIAFVHVREAAPDASVLELRITHPVPAAAMRAFAERVERCIVIEEGDPYLATAARALGLPIEHNAETFRHGELNVDRVRALLAGARTEELPLANGKPPQLCKGCPHRDVFKVLRDLKCIVAGDIGCYTLAVLPPYEAIDSCLCMGAGIGVGLGLRHTLPPDEARRVVSVIGDSTFVHSGITGLVEMVYNPPPTGHLVIILDNGATAMTGLQDHPATGRRLDGQPSHQLKMEDIARAVGVPHVQVVETRRENGDLDDPIRDALARDECTVIIARRPCLLAARKSTERACPQESPTPPCPAT